MGSRELYEVVVGPSGDPTLLTDPTLFYNQARGLQRLAPAYMSPDHKSVQKQTFRPPLYTQNFHQPVSNIPLNFFNKRPASSQNGGGGDAVMPKQISNGTVSFVPRPATTGSTLRYAPPTIPQQLYQDQLGM